MSDIQTLFNKWMKQHTISFELIKTYNEMYENFKKIVESKKGNMTKIDVEEMGKLKNDILVLSNQADASGQIIKNTIDMIKTVLNNNGYGENNGYWTREIISAFINYNEFIPMYYNDLQIKTPEAEKIYDQAADLKQSLLLLTSTNYDSMPNKVSLLNSHKTLSRQLLNNIEAMMPADYQWYGGISMYPYANLPPIPPITATTTPQVGASVYTDPTLVLAPTPQVGASVSTDPNDLLTSINESIDTMTKLIEEEEEKKKNGDPSFDEATLAQMKTSLADMEKTKADLQKYDATSSGGSMSSLTMVLIIVAVVLVVVIAMVVGYMKMKKRTGGAHYHNKAVRFA